ncbi:hypothetical protein M8C21_012958 [Ambrosia artemisiifolia]|uniref:Uncharacterized protein n=1 Tax=Ambrosia artemisiifolia TaxID=4212 RepID=A0AAD5CXZ5_AMBAR|nr:hypothetical protein M8C21_012958 [Ambrosia artemisiifolia]
MAGGQASIKVMVVWVVHA